jgi:hypothetical protein
MEQAPQGAVRAPRSPNAPSTRSAIEDHVLGLQQSAGNQAVVQSLAANAPSRQATTTSVTPAGQASAVAGTLATAQREAAQAAPSPALGPDFAAMWTAEVIVPLGRVTFLVEEEGMSLGAMRRLIQALEAIMNVLGATPRDDPNRLRVQVLARMIGALLELVSLRGGNKSTNQELLADMILWRSQAVDLEPLIRHAPGKKDGTESPAQAWHQLVVLPLGRAQVRLEQSPGEAIQGYLHAFEGILLTLQATPRDDPVRLRITSLSVGVRGMLDLLEATTGLGSPDVTGRAIEAFQAAEALGARLAGKPLPSPSGPAETAGDVAKGQETGKEPQFTWERQGGPILDSDQLERP